MGNQTLLSAGITSIKKRSFWGITKGLFGLKKNKSPGWSISDTLFVYLDISAMHSCDRILLDCIAQSFPAIVCM